jgi:hypothetical protein
MMALVQEKMTLLASICYRDCKGRFYRGPCLENDWSEARGLSNTPWSLGIRVDINTVWLLEELRANLEGRGWLVAGLPFLQDIPKALRA